ncbi:MAG: MFS transporter [Chloroflexota bacterium]
MKIPFTRNYWSLLILQMVERLAYWTALLQLPMYIAQKDVAGGLGWEQTTKGIIFFWWALTQNLTSALTGGLADRYGRKLMLRISFVVALIGYALLATQNTFYPFLAGVLAIGVGVGMFRPALMGSITGELSAKNSSTGWGVFVMLSNAAIFLAPPLSIFLKGFAWSWVFWGAAIVFSINFLLVEMVSESVPTQADASPEKISFLAAFRELKRDNLWVFLLVMSGFTLIYMQFYETLPNFIVDWSNTTAIAPAVPEFMRAQTANGTVIAFEWLYNINAGLIVLLVAVMAKIFARVNAYTALIIGVSICAAGLAATGLTTAGAFTVAGFIIYSFGEMIANPKFTEQLGVRAPRGKASLYMGFLYYSWAIGLAGGALLGGWLYKTFGEKSGLAIRFLKDYYGETAQHATAFTDMLAKTRMNPLDATALLWDLYSPQKVWYVFLAVGVLTVIGLIAFRRRSRASANA